MYYVFVIIHQTHMTHILFGFGLVIAGTTATIIGGAIWNATWFGRLRRLVPTFGLFLALAGTYTSFCGADFIDPTAFSRFFDVNFYNIFL